MSVENRLLVEPNRDSNRYLIIADGGTAKVLALTNEQTQEPRVIQW